MRFLADENVPLPSIYRLRSAGYSVAAIIEDAPGTTDLDVLARAARDGLVILTFDRDYGELIFRQKQPPPAGVVFCRFTPTAPEDLADLLLKILGAGIDFQGKFTVVERNQIRQRLLV
jgi:predicted nuclease of predicted toxin-antitoxin system